MNSIPVFHLPLHLVKLKFEEGQEGIITNSTLATAVFAPASKAYDCLTSVPINKTAHGEYVRYLKTLWSFQSTSAYMKNPPASYQQPAFDFVGSLDALIQAIENGTLTNDYEVEVALKEIVWRTHDGHIQLTTNTGSAFTWLLYKFSFTSLSIDGTSLPKVYSYGMNIAQR